MSARSKIVNALVTLLKDNLNGIDYSSNVHNNVENKLVFWDEINNFPFIGITAGAEARQYLPSNFKWGFVTLSIKIIIKQSDPSEVIEQYLEDIENLLDANNNLLYDSDNGKTTELISILSIDTDQGLLEPLGVGEMVIQIQYDI